MKAAAILIIVALCSVPLRAQTSKPAPDNLPDLKQLVTEERWQEIVQIAEAIEPRTAELNYYYGIALARLERWAEAEKVFKHGLNQQPGDKRFPLELAGVYFRQKEYSDAASYLRHALGIDSEDEYANDFLGSVYFLQGNLEAALKYWNRVSKPQIETVALDPTPTVDPILLDRAFVFAPATVLRLSDLQTTEARVDGLGIFPSYRFDLEIRADGKFDVVFSGRERRGWGANKWEALLLLFRGLPIQTIHPEFFNIRGQAINFVSLVRWDSQKRRLWSNLSGPLFGDPRWRYQLDLDLRNENWDIRDSSIAGKPLLADLNLRTRKFAAGITSIVDGRLEWSTRAELSHRTFRNVNPGSALLPHLLAEGYQLKHMGQLSYRLIQAPERRFTITSGVAAELGRTWSRPSNVFTKVQGSVGTHWFPKATGDDYEMQSRIRAGKTFGQVPFDELFVLGIQRENDLRLRGHRGTRDGRKGSAPMGRNYFLLNWEVDKNVYRNGLITLKLGPFVDTGKITDPAPGLGSKRWLWDVGGQAKVRMFGMGVTFSYGRDLRTGNDAFYISFR